MKKLWILTLLLSVMIFMTPDTKAGVFDHVFEQNTLDQVFLNPYHEVLANWYQADLKDSIELLEVITPNDFNVTNGYLSLDENYEAFLVSNNLPIVSNGEVFSFDETKGDTLEIPVSVEQTGLYKIGLDYMSETTSIHDIEVSIKVNGEAPYYEATQLTLNTFWKTNKTFNKDRYGNDIMPSAEQVVMWHHDDFKDASRLYEQGLLFKFDAGLNTVTLEKMSGSLKIGQVYVRNYEQYPAYEDYLKGYEQIPVVKDALIEIQAETVDLKNNVSIRYGTDRNPKNWPNHLVEARLNVVDGATFNKSGRAVYYDVEVTTSGLYRIAVKAKQSKAHTKVFRTLTINGKVPFKEAERISFDAGDWWNYVLGNEAGAYVFYLEAGLNRIGLAVNSAPYRTIYQNINDVMRRVNDLSIDIRKLTGNQIDENRDWEITEYLPNLESDLRSFGSIIETSYRTWLEIVGTDKDSDVSSGLKMAFHWLYELADDPNGVPRNMNRLTGPTASVMQRLGIILPLVIESPLTFDALFIHGEETWLPAPKPNFFENIWYEILRFFASFFSDQFGIASEPNELNIWVNRSRQYVDLMQQMTDDEFSVDTGMKVNISLMPNEDKLILATASGSQPDLAMGVAGWRPYDFAIRNALVDLSELDGFMTFTENFKKGAFMQLIYQEGVYGIPETQNFNLLFYRKDILSSLSLEVPDTWEDVIDMLPELQRFGMNFYSMLSSTSAFKSFSVTMPFIMQHGGHLYSDDALRGHLDSEENILAMTLMTDLFTVYALPLEVGSFYNQFRYGNIPVGIGDFGMYIQLMFAAPEIAGLWDIAPLPGILNDGVVDRSYDGASTSAMIFKNSSHVNEAWDFLKWWLSTEVQIRYAENLMTRYGAEYMWNTANVEAFKGMSFNATHKEMILEQWQWVLDTAKTPAAYMLERELSNAWNKVVYDGMNVRIAMEDAESLVNKEIERKMIEFGFITPTGDILIPYILPTKDTLDHWVVGHDGS